MTSLIINGICFLALLYYLTESINLDHLSVFKKHIIRFMITIMLSYFILDIFYLSPHFLKYVLNPLITLLIVKNKFFNKLLFKGLGHSK